jgi:hypothetical protein
MPHHARVPDKQNYVGCGHDKSANMGKTGNPQALSLFGNIMPAFKFSPSRSLCRCIRPNGVTRVSARTSEPRANRPRGLSGEAACPQKITISRSPNKSKFDDEFHYDNISYIRNDKPNVRNSSHCSWCVRIRWCRKSHVRIGARRSLAISHTRTRTLNRNLVDYSLESGMENRFR